ncbi:hypothetical protein BC834DRAFT_220985 [Gloeopeniophorella convolvens]|nr:hypothetical protein BC834DRAFT_220985 [Gloeopeniophorella convolvens]
MSAHARNDCPRRRCRGCPAPGSLGHPRGLCATTPSRALIPFSSPPRSLTLRFPSPVHDHQLLHALPPATTPWEFPHPCSIRAQTSRRRLLAPIFREMGLCFHSRPTCSFDRSLARSITDRSCTGGTWFSQASRWDYVYLVTVPALLSSLTVARYDPPATRLAFGKILLIPATHPCSITLVLVPRFEGLDFGV